MIAGHADAVIVARVLAIHHPECLTLVVLDSTRAVLDAIPIADTVSVEEVAEVIVSIARQSRVAEVLYVTADPPGGALVHEDDVVCWHRVRRMHAQVGMPVIDWLLVSGGLVRSMADTTGTARW